MWEMGEREHCRRARLKMRLDVEMGWCCCGMTFRGDEALGDGGGAGLEAAHWLGARLCLEG